MNLYIKQRVFSWADRFTVYDEHGNDRYYVEGEVFSWGKKLHILDLRDRELIFIQQKVWSFLPKYHIFRGGTQVAEVVKEFTFFRQEYSVLGPDWQVHGDFFEHEYEVHNGVQCIVGVSKQWWSWGDTYELRIDPTVDEVLALAVVLVIDACLEAQQN